MALPFARFARAHALFAAGDTLVAIALAGSLFFSISPDAARGRVALYLLLTMAPFAVVAPLIGPFLDQREGGRRTMVIASAASQSSRSAARATSTAATAAASGLMRSRVVTGQA